MKRKNSDGGGFIHPGMSSPIFIFYRVGVVVLMAFLYKGTVCTEVTEHITISTGQTAAPDDAEAAPNCCFITQKKKEKKRTSSPLR